MCYTYVHCFDNFAVVVINIIHRFVRRDFDTMAVRFQHNDLGSRF